MQNLKKELEIMNRVQVPLSSPDIIEKYIEAVVKVIKTRYLSIGARVVQFKKKVN